MPIACQAYYTVRDRLRAFLTSVSRPQLTNLSLMTFGLFAASHCQLPRVATRLPLMTGPASVATRLPLMTGPASLTQRLRRLLMNKAIEPATLYPPVARFLLFSYCPVSRGARCV